MGNVLSTPIRISLALVAGLASLTASAQDVYPTSPDWTSADTQVSTGAALVDLDGDGWLDLVVANGNDMQQQRLAVYHNNGDGTFPPSPDWQSDDDDVAYNGHLDVADVNGDGWPDVAVAVLGRNSSVDNVAKLYLNNNGVLSSPPDWQADEIAHAFGCAFGDVNNDGRPDLALAIGWAYSPQAFYSQYLYLNIGGALSSTASWSSTDTDHLQGVLWTDADRDGWLDLVGVASGAQTRVYANLGGSLSTTASWSTTDSADQDGIMGVAGDVNGDGYDDLIVTDNTQLGGTGRFRQYNGVTGGFYETAYDWNYYERYGSAVALADVDGDGALDLATGAWWDQTRLFLNTGTGLPSAPNWSSGPSSVIEKIVFGDVDKNALRLTLEDLPANGGRLFQLARRPIQDVVAVVRDGIELEPHEFVLDRDDGWITVATAPAATLQVQDQWSAFPDMAISNWDDTVGNFLYYNRLGGIFSDGFESGDTSMWSAAVERASPTRLPHELAAAGVVD